MKIRYLDEHGKLIPILPRRNWVKWLAEQQAKKDGTFKEFLDKCIVCGKELAYRYNLDSIEVSITHTSIHFNYVKGTTLYLCVIPRKLVQKTHTILPHMEKALRLQLIRRIKRIKKAGEIQKKDVVPTYGKGWLNKLYPY